MRPDIPSPAAAGVTLVELLVALTLSSVVVLALSEVYRSTLFGYNLQTQTSSTQQCTYYMATMLQDAFLQVGADLPDSGLAVIEMGSACDDSVAVKVNPRGGTCQFEDSVYCPAGTRRIPVSDARGFVKRDARPLVLAKRKSDHSQAVVLLSINESCNSGNFHDGVDTVGDSLALSTSVDFGPHDVLYAYVTDYFVLHGSTLCRNGDTLTEGIDSLAFCFRDSTGAATSQWDDMRTARITVRGVTAGSHPNYKGTADHRPRLAVEKVFRLRNRL
jgi:hypothetical protein